MQELDSNATAIVDAASTDNKVDVGILDDGITNVDGGIMIYDKIIVDTTKTTPTPDDIAPIPLVTDPMMNKTTSPQITDLDDLSRCLECTQAASNTNLIRCLKCCQATSQSALARSQATFQATFQAASTTNLDQRMELFERQIMTTLMTKMTDDVMTVAIPRVTQAVDETVNKHITTISHKRIAETLDSIIKNKLEDGIHDSISKDKRVIATEL
jgi:hypothetical protein